MMSLSVVGMCNSDERNISAVCVGGDGVETSANSSNFNTEEKCLLRQSKC